MAGPLIRNKPERCTTARAAFYSFRESLGPLDPALVAALETAFLSGVAWAYARQRVEIEKSHSYIAERLGQLQ